MKTVEDLIGEIVEIQIAIASKVKAHREAADAGMQELQRWGRKIAILRAEEEPDPEPEVVDASAPEDAHIIDMGDGPSEPPVVNPFADRPDSLASTLWTLMRDGGEWHVARKLMPTLKHQGYTPPVGKVYHVFREHPKVFERTNGGYRVTQAYRVRTPDDDA